MEKGPSGELDPVYPPLRTFSARNDGGGDTGFSEFSVWRFGDFEPFPAFYKPQNGKNFARLRRDFPSYSDLKSNFSLAPSARFEPYRTEAVLRRRRENFEDFSLFWEQFPLV